MLDFLSLTNAILLYNIVILIFIYSLNQLEVTRKLLTLIYTHPHAAGKP